MRMNKFDCINQKFSHYPPVQACQSVLDDDILSIEDIKSASASNQFDRSKFYEYYDRNIPGIYLYIIWDFKIFSYML